MQIGEAGPLTTSFVFTSLVTSAGAADTVGTQGYTSAYSLYRANTVVAGNVNWAYSSVNEWSPQVPCLSTSAYCYTFLGCVGRVSSPVALHLTRFLPLQSNRLRHPAHHRRVRLGDSHLRSFHHRPSIHGYLLWDGAHHHCRCQGGLLCVPSRVHQRGCLGHPHRRHLRP